jgi:GNAT superfamily N-acetyltransferase
VAHVHGGLTGHPPVPARLRLEVDRLDSEVGGALVAALLDDLRARYGAEDPDRPDASELAPPSGVFLVAWVGEEPVGCGGVRAHAGNVGELKRMYVKRAARRTGVARAVLTELESRARRLGYERLRLETGVRQPEAIELYRSAGYEPIEPYGIYRDEPLSRCFEKRIV